jgi:hypothetical protein
VGCGYLDVHEITEEDGGQKEKRKIVRKEHSDEQ